MKLADRLRGRSGMRADFALTLLGHSGERVLAGLAGVLVIGLLSQSDYGIYVGAMALFAVAAKVADLGLDTTTVRTVARGRRQGRESEEEEILAAVFLAKIGLATGAFIGLWILAPLLTRMLDRAWMVPYVRLAGLGLFGKQLTGFYRAWFAGRLQFGRNAVFLALGPAAFLAGLAVATALGRLTLPACIGLAAVAPLVAVGLLTLTVGRGLLVRPWRGLWRLREVVSFSRWIYASDVMATLRTRLGSLLLLRLAESETAAQYGAADGLASCLSIAGNTVLTVLVPRAAGLNGADELRSFLRRSYVGLGLVLLVLPAAPICAALVRPLVEHLKPDYLPALPIFTVLFASMLFTIAALPSGTVLYSIGRPQVETAIEVVALATTLGGLLVFVPEHGALGAAYAMLVQRVVSAALSVGWVYLNVYRRAEQWSAPQAVESSAANGD